MPLKLNAVTGKLDYYEDSSMVEGTPERIVGLTYGNYFDFGTDDKTIATNSDIVLKAGQRLVFDG